MITGTRHQGAAHDAQSLSDTITHASTFVDDSDITEVRSIAAFGRDLTVDGPSRFPACRLELKPAFSAWEKLKATV